MALFVPLTVAATDGMDIFLTGPTYTQKGALINYELKLVNKSTKTLTNLEVWNDLPANVTHVSGGQYFDGEAKYVIFQVASLAPRSEVYLSWIGRADNGLAVNSVISNGSFGFNNAPAGVEIGYGDPANTKIDVIGTLEAVYKDVNGVAFNVALDSFGFQNFVHNSPAQVRNFANDLLPEDLFRLFGPIVYKSQEPGKQPTLTAAAQTWLTAQIDDMNLGVCEGMAAASLRLFNWDSFKDYSSPDSIQSGAATAVDLNFPGDVVENYVSYYYNTQYADEVRQSQIDGTANETIATLEAGWNAETPIPYTLAIFILKDGQISGGHAIAPYGIERVSAIEKRILVYDNNYPKQRQYITVNTATDSWRYVTAATPGQDDSIYEGSGTTNKLSLTPNLRRDNPEGVYFEPPFSYEETFSEASLRTTAAHSAPGSALAEAEPRNLIFSYIGEGAYVVVDAEGRSTGYASDHGDFVDEIPGATVTHHRGGLGLNVPPRISIPFDGPDDTYYSVFVHATTEGNVTAGDLHITGPGFSVGVNDISLDPFEAFEFSISPDGDHISFYATEAIEAPELIIAHDPVHAGDPSIIFDIEGVTLLAGETVMIDLDPVLERVHFNHTGPEAENFDVDMKQIWSDGDEAEYDQMVHLPAGTASAFVDFGAWDGLGHPALYIDDVLQNPSVNHRLKLLSSVGTYDSTPQTNAPAGVYRVEATFQNVTEVSFGDVSFDVADLRAGDTLLNADAESAGAWVSVPAEALGEDGILHMNESFTFTFEVGLSSSTFAGLTVDANGIPHDWVHPDPAPSYDANDASFAFAGEGLLPWGGFELVTDSGGYVWADTADWMGWVLVQYEPYIYIASLGSWAYMIEPAEGATGAWIYFFK